LRILILSFYFKPDLCAGSFRTSALVDELLKNAPGDVHFDVVTTLPNRYSSFSVDAEETESSDRLKIHRVKLPSHNSGMFDQSKAFLHFSKEAVRVTKSTDYDLVYATSSRLMTAVLGAWVARKKRAKLYLDIRDIFVDTVGDVLPPKIATIVKPVFSLVERLAFSRADKINLVSRGFEGYFKERYPKGKFSWFTNGIDNEFIEASPSGSDDFERKDPVKILYAGNIGEGQGLHEIIPEMAKRLSGKAVFQIIGDGGRKAQLQDSLKEHKLGNVELLPPVNRNELVKAYKQADVLFLHLNDYPAFRKVLPSKLFEYAAMGKPILAGVAGYAEDFVKDEIDNAAVFAPCDAEQAEIAFVSLGGGVKPRTEFLQKFSRKRIMRDMAADILSLCSE